MKFPLFQESRIGKRNASQDRFAHCHSRDNLAPTAMQWDDNAVLGDGIQPYQHSGSVG